MIRLIRAALLATLAALGASAQESVGDLILKIGEEEHRFVLIQGSDGPNPGSRYSLLAGDVVMTIVGVLGETARRPEDAEATVELRFTVDGSGPEVRTGSVISYSTRGRDEMRDARSGTVEIALESLDAGEDALTASGTFTAALPADPETSGTEVEGTFHTAIKSRDALDQ